MTAQWGFEGRRCQEEKWGKGAAGIRSSMSKGLEVRDPQQEWEQETWRAEGRARQGTLPGFHCLTLPPGREGKDAHSLPLSRWEVGGSGGLEGSGLERRC